MPGILTKTREKLQDKYLSLLEAQQDIEAAAGELLPDMLDAYTLETLAHGKARDRMERLEKDVLKPLKRIMDSGLTLAQLEDYLLARHAPERNRRIARVNLDMPDGAAGITTADAEAVLAGNRPGPYSGKRLSGDQLAAAQRAAALIDKMREQSLRLMVRSGSISKELADQLGAAYKHYVPLRGKEGLADLGRGHVGGGRVDYAGPKVRRAAGRGAGNLPKNILAEMIGDAQRAIIGAELAPVREAVLRMAMQHPSPEAWEVAPVELERRLNKTTGEFYLAPKNERHARDDSLLIPLDGKVYRLQFIDPHLRDALLNLGREDLGAVMRAFSTFNRWQSAVLTRYNPAFPPINLIRDVGLGVTRIASQHGSRMLGEVVAGYGPAMWAIYSDVRNAGRGDASKTVAQRDWIDWAREFVEAGGKTGYMRADDIESVRRKTVAGLRSLNDLWSDGALGKATASKEAVKRAVLPLAEAVEHVNDAVENAIRLSYYVALRRSGTSAQQAARAAKDLTVNFNRKGTWANHLNGIFLFYNAAVQGTHAVVKALKDPRVVGALTALSGLQALFAIALMADDPDDDGVSTWDSIPEWRKRMSLIVPAPWTDEGYFAIPMTYGFNMFTFAGGRIVEYARDKGRGDYRPEAKFATDTFAALVQSVSPLPLDDGPAAILGHVPNILLKLARNRDDFGRPITRETYGREVPAASLGQPHTAKPFHAASKALNRIGGGSDDEVPWLAPVLTDVSPEQLDFIWRTVTGGLGSTLSRGQSLVEGVIGGRYEDLWEGLASGPITGSFGFKGRLDRAVADRYYAERDRLDVMRARLNNVAADLLDQYGTERPGDLNAALAQAAAEFAPYMDGVRIAEYQRNGRTADGERYFRGQVRTRISGGRVVPVLEWSENAPVEVLRAVERAVSDQSQAIREARIADLSIREREAAIRAARRRRMEAQQRFIKALRYRRLNASGTQSR